MAAVLSEEQEYDLAAQRGQAIAENVPYVTEAVYSPTVRRVLLLLSNGLEIAIRQDDFDWMRRATSDELNEIEIYPGGHSIYFPELDEGFDIPELLQHMLGVRRFLKRHVEEEEADYAASRAA